MGLFGAIDGEGDGLVGGDAIAFFHGDELVELGRLPLALIAEDEGGGFAGGSGVGFPVRAGVFLEEGFGGIDDDELVRDHEAKAAAFIEDVAGGGVGTVERDDVDFAVGLDEGIAKGFGLLLFDEAIRADEEEDGGKGGGGRSCSGFFGHGGG